MQGIELQRFGFVHVTGLIALDVGSRGGEWEVCATEEDRGRWNTNNNMIAAVTTEGEIWLAKAGQKVDLSTGSELARVLEGLCPHGQGGLYVPCSNGQTIDGLCLLGRMQDPAEDFCGTCPTTS